jgi:voltage-gated potassium channel
VDRIDSHNNFYYFTGALIFLLLASAYVSTSPDGEDHRLLQGVMFLTELIAYFSLNLSRAWRIFVGLMLVFMLATNGLHEFTQLSLPPLIALTASLFFYCGMAYAAARQVLFTGAIEVNTVVGTVAVYLLLGLIWTVLYLITLEIWPAGINGIEYKAWSDNFGIAAYFSYTTMTTVGYGEMTPAIPITRTLANLQAITGTFYMAVVVASMVGRVSNHPK